MNIRSLTRGDGVVIGAAVLLFIASFLDFYSARLPGGSTATTSTCRMPGTRETLCVVLPTCSCRVIGAALIIVSRAFQPESRKVAGLDLGQFGVALTVFAAWDALWTIIVTPDTGSPGAGADPRPARPPCPGRRRHRHPARPGPQGRPGGAAAPAAPPRTAPAAVRRAGPAAAGYGYPGAGQQPAVRQPQPGQPGQPYGGQPGSPASAASRAAAGRPARGGRLGLRAVLVRGAGGPPAVRARTARRAPIAELAPGTWYLAVEQRGPGLVAQTQDGRRGVLQDTTGIQRG